MNWIRWKLRVDHALGQARDREGLRETGDTLEQHVAAGENAHEHPVDHHALPDDRLPEFVPTPVEKFLRASNFARQTRIATGDRLAIITHCSS